MYLAISICVEQLITESHAIVNLSRHTQGDSAGIDLKLFPDDWLASTIALKDPLANVREILSDFSLQNLPRHLVKQRSGVGYLPLYFL